MEKVITGKAHIFGDNIDTDQICPGRYLELTDPDEIALHCLEGARPSFVSEFKKGDIVVGGTNFGCGSSREHAAIALKSLGVSAVIAKSFARIFYRNAINLGLTVVVCPDLDELCLGNGEEVTVDIGNGTVSAMKGKIFCEPISGYALEILRYGGIINMIKAQRYDRGAAF